MSKSFDIQVNQTLYPKNPNTRETYFHMKNRHQMTNRGITSVIGQSRPWGRK